MTDIGIKIKYLRQNKKWNQAELAQKIYVTPQAISKWERGLSKPTTDSQLLLSELFDVSLDKLSKECYSIQDLTKIEEKLEQLPNQTSFLTHSNKSSIQECLFYLFPFAQKNPLIFFVCSLFIGILLYFEPILFLLFICVCLAFIDFKKAIIFIFSFILLLGLFFFFAAV